MLSECLFVWIFKEYFILLVQFLGDRQRDRIEKERVWHIALHEAQGILEV